MGRRRNLLGAIRRKLARSSCRAIDVAAVDVESAGQEEEHQAFPDDRSALIGKKCTHGGASALPPDGGGSSIIDASADGVLTPEDMAAVKIQATYRGHLARRAFRALRGLVKLQALVRGFCVRRQVRAAMQCMQALVRLQVRVRTRQLLGRSPRDAELID